EWAPSMQRRMRHLTRTVNGSPRSLSSRLRVVGKLPVDITPRASGSRRGSAPPTLEAPARHTSRSALDRPGTPRGSALVVEDLGQGVFDRDEVGLIGHHGVDVLVGVRVFIDEVFGARVVPRAGSHVVGERLAGK